MSQSQFYAHENVSLEKNVDSVKLVETKPEDIDYVYEINKCVNWIKTNNFRKVCLQFPDYLLPDSSDVAFKLQTILNQTVYILGDTTYESCCIDYIAAAHINADAIIHFGPVCFSKTSANIRYLNIYEKYDIDIEKFKANYLELFDSASEITILVDTVYIHRIDDIRVSFEMYKNVVIQQIDEEPLVIKNKIIIFLGENERKLINIQLTFQPSHFYYFKEFIQKFEVEARILKRRNYLIEKIKDSKTIGIIIGTLCVQNYMKIIQRLMNLFKSRGKKYYLICVGKPTVAKLANFQEVEIYVMVTCSMSDIYENRDFYQPIVTPFDVEVALNTNYDKNIKFSYDYNSFLDDRPQTFSEDHKNTEEADVSLLTNRIRTLGPDEVTVGAESSSTQLALKPDGTVMIKSSSGAEFLTQRSWKGLDDNVDIKEAEIAQEGRSGTATKYKNEPM